MMPSAAFTLAASTRPRGSLGRTREAIASSTFTRCSMTSSADQAFGAGRKVSCSAVSRSASAMISRRRLSILASSFRSFSRIGPRRSGGRAVGPKKSLQLLRLRPPDRLTA